MEISKVIRTIFVHIGCSDFGLRIVVLLQQAVLNCSVVSNSFQLHGLQPTDSSTHGFPGQEYWSELPFPPPGNLPNPGFKFTTSPSPALAGQLFTTELPGKPITTRDLQKKKIKIKL